MRWSPTDPISCDGCCKAQHASPAPLPSDVIVLAVRWYLRFGLSYRDVEELLTERGVVVDHVPVYRRVLRFTPLLAEYELLQATPGAVGSGFGPLVCFKRALAGHNQRHVVV
jgi:hypothetical protein